MRPKKRLPAVPDGQNNVPKRNSGKFIRDGLEIPGEFPPEQQAARAARVAAGQAAAAATSASAATAGSSGNAPQPRKVSNAAPQPASGIDEKPRQPSESKIPSRLTISNDVASRREFTPAQVPVPKFESSFTKAESKPVSKGSSIPTASTTTSTPNQPGSNKPPAIPKSITAGVDRRVSVPADKTGSKKPSIPKLSTASNRRSTPAPLSAKKAGESPISTLLTSAPLRPTHKQGFGFMDSTASSNSHKKSEPSVSQEKGGHEVPKTTTDSPENPLNPHLPHEVPSPIEGFLQVNLADHARRTRNGVLLGGHPLHNDERELGPKDEDNEDNQSDSSGSSSSFVDSPIDGLKREESYQHLIATASAEKPEDLDPENGNKEDGQSTTSGHSSPFVLSPPIGPAPIEALPALPASFNPSLGPFKDTTPAHTIASPLLSEEEGFDPEKSLAVDLEGLYDALGLGITIPDFQSQLQSEIEESISLNTSTPPTPPLQHGLENTRILTSPRWSLKSQNTVVVLEDHNDSLVAGTERAVKNLGEFVRDEGKKIDGLSDDSKDLCDENKKLSDEDKELKEQLSQGVEVVGALEKALLEVGAAAKEESEELRRKLKASEDNARLDREELGKVRRELQSAKLEIELGKYGLSSPAGSYRKRERQSSASTQRP